MDTVKSLILHHSFAIENEKVLSQGEILTFKKVLFYYLSEGNRIGKKETVTINKSIAARNFTAALWSMLKGPIWVMPTVFLPLNLI